jgi:hypothetical protein
VPSAHQAPHLHRGLQVRKVFTLPVPAGQVRLPHPRHAKGGQVRCLPGSHQDYLRNEDSIQAKTLNVSARRVPTGTLPVCRMHLSPRDWGAADAEYNGEDFELGRPENGGRNDWHHHQYCLDGHPAQKDLVEEGTAHTANSPGFHGHELQNQGF